MSAPFETLIYFVLLFFVYFNFILNTFILYIFFSVDVCQSYQNLTSAKRKTTNEVLDGEPCDRNDIPGEGEWYRFQGKAGSRMATTCPDRGSCASFPGWLDGDPPTVKYGEKPMTVFFRKNSNCKKDSRSITVKNCGAYTIYRLFPATTCTHRYCGTD